ncbi:TetR family transcriptional regulator [Mycobacterium kansasii]|uniref:TetR/AcrR family transcriptional regulator n=1 Tax=Mycobacterium kansasii TaxID=1768 RepID=UPI000CDE3DA2|nr:TetR/AcrR family transcriptional regulator [Mycobacterium kansasii]POX82816.1 TetR family transcriptional regulator [Mycobacterium kansasii]POX99449.1 TetR family transcriptional regulator [Mycobacterium kansasii]POY18998.1 TetR family transcriptional regulator [Mycobacterium kansasii]
MSTSSAPRRKRGRPREFNLDAATAALERALWSRGFRSTSVEQLAAEAGLSLSSLYAAFGSKQGVLAAALARYECEMSGILGELESGARGLPDIERFVDRVRAVLETPASPTGCFMVNTMVEVGDGIPEVQELVAAYRRRIERALKAALDTAARAGDIEAGSSQDRARLIQAALFGAMAVSRAGDLAPARAALQSITRELRRWRSHVRR